MRHSHRTGFGKDHGNSSSPKVLASVVPLDQMDNNSVVVVVRVAGTGPLPHRLQEMGFVPGTVIRVIRRAPLADPIEFELKGYLISLRSAEARLVEVRPFDKPHLAHCDPEAA